MRGTYWPIFIIVASAATAAVWSLTPRYVDDIPDGLKTWCCRTVARARNAGRPPITRPPERAPEPAITPIGNGGRAPGASLAETRDALPEGFAERPRRTHGQAARPARPTAAAQPAPPGPAAVPSVIPATASSDDFSSVRSMQPIDPKALPSLKGVLPADPKTATWGVVNRITELEDLENNDLGTVQGGRFFIIERRFRSEAGLMCIGNFTPKRLATAVQIPAENLICFSGSPDNLDEDQRHALRMYYQLRGEAIELKAELTKRRYDENDNPVESTVDPLKDPHYFDMLEQMKSFAARIVGLAF